MCYPLLFPLYETVQRTEGNNPWLKNVGAVYFYKTLELLQTP